MNFRKIKIGDKSEQISENVDYNFHLVESEINVNVQNLSSMINATNRFCQDFVQTDFNEGTLEIILPEKWITESNITVYEKKSDNTYEVVYPDINIINNSKFTIVSDVGFEGKVVVSYE